MAWGAAAATTAWSRSWAAGVERILLASGQEEQGRDAPVFVAVAEPAASRRAFGLLRELRRRGLPVEMEQSGRSVKGQFKHADRIGARAVVIVGDRIEVKDMQSGEQRAVSDADEAARLVARTQG